MVENVRSWHEMLPYALLGYRTTVRTSTGATPYLLVCRNEAVIPGEVKIPSLRIIQEAGLSNEEWVRARYEQLMLIDEKRMAVVCHGQLYQYRMVRAFNKKVRARGFDVTVSVSSINKWLRSLPPGSSFICPLEDVENDPEIIKMSQLAINKYNSDKGRDYKFVKILKPNQWILGGILYYITFVAKDNNNKDTLQAQVWEKPGGEKYEVDFCRLKGGTLTFWTSICMFEPPEYLATTTALEIGGVGVTGIDSECVFESLNDVLESLSTNENIKIFRFTSWCNIGLYNVDFGWGKPVWIAHMGDLPDAHVRSKQ
ncbi:hypothetical protein CQW23_33460 [Capsicum baccatum]|uniref:Cystatin domain-containing protein n=1 Tax=Capsicum baccatum TaxID=33114 RepID=A0A2G2V1S5_CAPBA|nr:hypothetical protein CQW23_33460 [Capsicum baccatum]